MSHMTHAKALHLPYKLANLLRRIEMMTIIMRTFVTLRRRLSLALLLALALTTQAKANNSDPQGALDTTTPTFTSLETTIFSVYCTQCHSGKTPAGSVDLTTYTNVMNAKVVFAGSATTSPLYRAVSKSLMPPKGPDLSADEITAIADWIDAGALNN